MSFRKIDLRHWAASFEQGFHAAQNYGPAAASAFEQFFIGIELMRFGHGETHDAAQVIELEGDNAFGKAAEFIEGFTGVSGMMLAPLDIPCERKSPRRVALDEFAVDVAAAVRGRYVTGDPTFQSDSMRRRKKYSSVNFALVSAPQTFSGVVAIYVT